jgi:hypothetical protein
MNTIEIVGLALASITLIAEIINCTIQQQRCIKAQRISDVYRRLSYR